MNSRVWSIAEREVADAAHWYEDQREGLGFEFLDEYEWQLKQIQDDPTRFPLLESIPVDRPIHRCRLRRFPYMIVYEVTSTEFVVLSVAHLHRDPDHLINLIGE